MKADNHVTSAPRPHQRRAVFDQKSWQPQIVLYVHTSAVPTQFMELIWSQHNLWAQILSNIIQ